jgi:LuxR family maltose regulon positive regulatory protein
VDSAAHLFLSALDDSGRWFRYHPLMRDALLHRLRHGGDIDIRQLHDRASAWFAAQQQWAEAIRHALAAGKSAAGMRKRARSLWRRRGISIPWCSGYATCQPISTRRASSFSLIWPGAAHRFRFGRRRQLLDAIETQSAAHGGALAHSSWVAAVVRAICEAFADNTFVHRYCRTVAARGALRRYLVDVRVCNILSYCHLADSRLQQALDGAAAGIRRQRC